jgi:hypothetical protein
MARDTEIEWEVVKNFPYRKVNEDKVCEACSRGFKTQREAGQHVIDVHNPVKIEKHGLFIYRTVVHYDWAGSRDRVLHVRAEGTFQGRPVPTNWHLKTFMEGAIWMRNEMRV